ncbi:MAG: SgcJ/EcaC family oxidoreductase [Hyphomonadaceae bacterium]|nr:SgcJ/EcaC family oxidoreductase [Hyphomonadaceae bacterium]
MFSRARPLALATAAALALAGCAKHQASHAAADDPHAPKAVVVTPGANLPDKREIAALFETWNETLRTGGPHDMALLYAEDGVLLPTVSNAVRTNRVEIAAYFEEFLAMHPRGVINEQHVDVLDSNTAVNSGVYTFDLIREGQPTFVVARYSYLYEKIGGKWLIKSHHSSAMPEPVTARPAPLTQVMAANVMATQAVAPAAAQHGPASVANHGPSPAPAHH